VVQCNFKNPVLKYPHLFSFLKFKDEFHIHTKEQQIRIEFLRILNLSFSSRGRGENTIWTLLAINNFLTPILLGWNKYRNGKLVCLKKQNILKDSNGSALTHRTAEFSRFLRLPLFWRKQLFENWILSWKGGRILSCYLP
jgi:hypothetical protein